MRDVTVLDSTGLGDLVLALGFITQTVCATCGSSQLRNDIGEWEACLKCWSTQRNAWGQLKFCNLGRQPTDLLHFTKVISVFQVEKTEAMALASFE